MKTYAIDLCNYDENNLPVPEVTVLVKSEHDLESLPYRIVQQNEVIQEVMEEHGCEGVGFIYEVSEKEIEEEYETTVADLIEV